jgi:hypothetical protein
MEIATGQRTGQLRGRDSISDGEKRFFSSPQLPYQLLSAPNSYPIRTGGEFLRDRAVGA